MIERLRVLLRRVPATMARMGGYWGGVVMRSLKRAGALAAAFLRRS